MSKIAKKTLEVLENIEEKVENDTVVVQPISITVRPLIPFPQWFSDKVKSGKLRVHQENALKVFAKKQGLTEIEHPDVYEELLKKF